MRIGNKKERRERKGSRILTQRAQSEGAKRRIKEECMPPAQERLTHTLLPSRASLVELPSSLGSYAWQAKTENRHGKQEVGG